MQLSPMLPYKVIDQLKLDEKKIDLLPIKGRGEYLEFHREKMFLKG